MTKDDGSFPKGEYAVEPFLTENEKKRIQETIRQRYHKVAESPEGQFRYPKLPWGVRPAERIESLSNRIRGWHKRPVSPEPVSPAQDELSITYDRLGPDPDGHPGVDSGKARKERSSRCH
jgi:hypothetical protein